MNVQSFLALRHLKTIKDFIMYLTLVTDYNFDPGRQEWGNEIGLVDEISGGCEEVQTSPTGPASAPAAIRNRASFVLWLPKPGDSYNLWCLEGRCEKPHGGSYRRRIRMDTCWLSWRCAASTSSRTRTVVGELWNGRVFRHAWLIGLTDSRLLQGTLYLNGDMGFGFPNSDLWLRCLLQIFIGIW